MFLQALVIYFLANVVVAKSAHLMAEVVRPESLSEEDHYENIRNFWTDERLKSAKPKHLTVTLHHLFTAMKANNSNVSVGAPSSVPGSLPTFNGEVKRGISLTGRENVTKGRVFWQDGALLYSCSASVISSNSKDLIVTAGHCVYDTDTKRWFNNNNWVFVPAFSNSDRPYGVWPARRFLIQPDYESGDFNFDVAFVALSTLDQRHIQEVVGAQGIGFNQPRSSFIDSFGYPSNIDSGLYLEHCSANAQPSEYRFHNYIGQGLPCNMGHGCSGGPWLQNIDSTGVGYVTSVNSFQIIGVANVMNGPYFENSIESLYNNATSI